MKNPRKNLPTWPQHHEPVNPPQFGHGSILSPSQGSTLRNKIFTEENATEAEVVVEMEVDIDTVDSAVGGVIHLDVGTAGEGGMKGVIRGGH